MQPAQPQPHNVETTVPLTRPGCWWTPINGALVVRTLLWMSGYVAVTLTVVVGLFFAWRAATGNLPPPAMLAVGVLGPVYLVQPIALYLHLLRRHDLSWSELGWQRPVHNPLHLLWQIPTVIFGSALATMLILTPLIGEPGEDGPAAFEDLVTGRWPLAVLGLLIVAVIVPVVEELVFRGLILAGLRRRFTYPVGIGLSAIIFAAVHLAPPALPYLLMVGIALAVMAEWYRSIIPGIVLHGVNNAIVFAVVLTSM